MFPCLFKACKLSEGCFQCRVFILYCTILSVYIFEMQVVHNVPLFSVEKCVKVLFLTLKITLLQKKVMDTSLLSFIMVVGSQLIQ